MLRELFAVAARAALEWALASLLLANGAAFCLIAAAAARLRLGPPCILCARVHRLLCSSSVAAAGDEGRDALRLLLCNAHLAAVAGEPSAASPGHGDGVQRKGGLEVGDQDKVSSGRETHRVVSIGSEICEQDHHDEQLHAADRSSSDDGNGPLVSLFELAPIVSRPRDDDNNSLGHATPDDELVRAEGRDDRRLAAERLASELRAQRRELEALRAELASERRARAEAEEYQRQLEEQGELDREAARLAMQLVHESETEKHGLQRQLDACRVRAQLYRSECAAAADDDDGGGCRREANGGGDGNNYQSLVDFLPGSVYSSSPDLANLLKLYTEAGNGGGRPERGGYEVSAVPVVEEEAEEEEEAIAVTATAGTESSGSVDATTTAIVAESSDERTHDCLIETVTEAA